MKPIIADRSGIYLNFEPVAGEVKKHLSRIGGALIVAGSCIATSFFLFSCRFFSPGFENFKLVQKMELWILTCYGWVTRSSIVAPLRADTQFLCQIFENPFSSVVFLGIVGNNP
jgi:hypothetical protein